MNSRSLEAIFKNVAWLIFDKLFMLGMNMVVIFVIANFYGPEKYGLFQYAVNIVLMLEIIVQLVDGRVVKKQYFREDHDQIVFNITAAKVLLSSAVLIIGIVIMLLSDRKGVFSALLFILMVDSIIKNFRFGMENRFEYFLQSKRVVLASNVGLFVGTLLQLYAVLNKMSITYIAVVQTISTLLSLGILYFQYVQEFKNRSKGHINRTLIYRIIRESLPLAIASAACVIYTRCDSLMIGILLSTLEVGIYSISSKLISTIQILIIPIQTTIFVKMMEWYEEPKRYEENYLRITSLITWISITGILCSFLILPFVFKMLKPEYLPAIEIYKLMSISTIFTYNAVLRSSHFTITHNGKILMVTQLITVIMNIILNYILIKLYGMRGAAVATVFSQFVSLFLSNAFYKEARFVFKNQIKAFNPAYIFKRKH